MNFFEMMARKTNDYAIQEINRASRKKLKSDENWTCVTKDERKSYVAYIAISQAKKPDIKMDWSKRKIIETPFYSTVMARDRYVDISRFSHFPDNTSVCNTNDKLRKIRPILSYYETKFLTLDR